VLVTSWNEWFEGSEIEPSADFGEQYLQITAEMAARFKSRSPRNRPVPGPEPSGLSTEALARWKGHTIGVLPESDSLAVWSLARLPLAVRSVSWDEVAQFQADKIKQLPVLLYGGEESYCRTAKQPGDVEEGLLRFLRAGGLLVVLPSGPMPFHYDETHKTLVFSRRLGLPLSVAGPEGGWEHPPAEVSLKFLLRDKSLAGLPEKFPFPAGGDRRWRPLVHKWLSSQDELMPLVELQDASGRSEGIAAGYIRLGAGEGRGGRVLYAWHGLMQTPQGQTLVDGLLAWLSERL
jgi:hypothetical protein